MKRVLALLTAVLLLFGVLAACNKITGPDGELKKGTIEKSGGEAEGNDSAWKPMTSAVRAELDAVYQQKLAATKAFAVVPAATGKTYYISSIHGNDSNNGLSPESAWASPQKANSAALKSGDLVLFECGSEFRRTSNETFIYTKSGVTYATYGTGEKPIFYGSIDASNPSQWKAVSGKQNLYYFTTQIGLSNDVGSIIFNNGEAWGIKIQMTYTLDSSTGTYTIPANKTLALSGVVNKASQTQPVNIPSYSLKNGTDLKGPDLSFYHDSKYVYLYCEGGNPATRFSSIELSQSRYAFNGSNVSNVTIMNLDFRYFGDHCVHSFDCTNFTVKNCSFFFIGGTIQQDGYGNTWRNYSTRLGNAVENWNSCDGMVVENCFFDQIFDTAMTTQSNSAVTSKNVVYRNNVSQNMWFGVELWTTSNVEFSNVDVSGNYFKNIGEGFTTQRPDKIDPGTTFSVNAFIKFSGGPYEMHNSCSVTDNIADGTNGKMLFCNYPKTNTSDDGVVFDRNTYVGATNVNFARLFGKYDKDGGVTYRYTEGGIAAIHKLGIEKNGTFYYTTSSEQGFDYDLLVISSPSYTYKAVNGVTLPFRLFFPEGYTEGASYPLVTILNRESASGNDNMQNVMASKTLISELISENKAIILVPQCPSGTWTGIPVSKGNYSTADTTETDVMKAVSAMIRDVADAYKASRKYAVGVDAGAYAVSDLLVRHKNLLAAGIVISGAGDPSASIGNAKVMIIHSEYDDIISSDNADALAKAWNAKYVLGDDNEYYRLQHDCWDYVAENEDLFGWLLTR